MYLDIIMKFLDSCSGEMFSHYEVLREPVIADGEASGSEIDKVLRDLSGSEHLING